MKAHRFLLGIALAVLLFPFRASAQAPETNSPIRLFIGTLKSLLAAVQPPTNEPPRTFTVTLKILKADGLSDQFAGHQIELALQAPDHLRLETTVDNTRVIVGRNGQEVWAHVPDKKFALAGSDRVPRWASDGTNTAPPIGPLRLPVAMEQLFLAPYLTDYEVGADEMVEGFPCRTLKVKAKPEAVRGFNLPAGTMRLWIREKDFTLLRLAYADSNGKDLVIEFQDPKFQPPWPADKWRLHPNPGDKVEPVANSHLTRSMDIAYKMIGERIPPLGPATGARRVVATEGKGRLEMIDGTRVLFLKGTPEEMGHQQGRLLQKEVWALTERILYGVGVGSSFEKGVWFIGEIESAQKRLTPFMDPRYLREMDALADATGLERPEVRLANVFPELFHCSGFAVFGKATVDGRMYHGRILDYLRGMGLEQNAVVTVVQPDLGNAWVNIGYAGFIGSVTAMNEKHIAIGEMGGRGEGHWDGKPMAQLVREVMEKAGTIDEAVEIMRKGPRTCEYYYVISDGKSKRAVGIAATPEKFETVWAGQSHPQLPHAVEDAVLLSADDRYEELVRRVKAGYGKLDAEGARRLMDRPVCMTSNIHSVLFAPDSLDFWVANADSEHVASAARYTHYNLAELLTPAKAK